MRESEAGREMERETDGDRGRQIERERKRERLRDIYREWERNCAYVRACNWTVEWEYVGGWLRG